MSDRCPECGSGYGHLGHCSRMETNLLGRIMILERQLAAANTRLESSQAALRDAMNERAGRLEKELAERGKDIMFFSELHDSAVESLAACDESPWRTMESAPLDKWVLAADGDDIAIVINLAGAGWLDDADPARIASPTHWMPLPAAPEGAREGGEEAR